MTTEIFVELLGEAVEVYRPVQAALVSEGVFRIESKKTDPDEVWRFPPGSVVRCRNTSFSGGEACLLAYELVEPEPA